MQISGRRLTIGLALTGLVSFIGGWMLHEPPPPKPERPAAAIRLIGGELVIRRDPLAAPPPTIMEAAAQVPGTPIRAGTITVQPKAPECPPVSVDWALVQQPDGARVIASSPNGRVTGGIDIPLTGGAASPARVWAAGAIYDPLHRRYGAFVERDLGRLRLGADVIQGDPGLTAMVRVGWRF